MEAVPSGKRNRRRSQRAMRCTNVECDAHSRRLQDRDVDVAART